MFLRHLDLTTALRPSLYDDETLLFVQDSVGLYEGKYKIPNYQNGHAYLTSHRVCYVDNGDPRKYSVAINLKEIERSEFYAGFLKSSPKITLFPKAAKKGVSAIRSPVPRYASPSDALVGSVGSSLPTSTPSPAPARDVNATWVCSICGMSNQVPPNFDPATANEHTPLSPCQACGIKPPLVTMVKAAISAMSNRPSRASGPTTIAHGFNTSSNSGLQNLSSQPAIPPGQCPRCTFQNHPSLSTCEVCGASLQTATDRRVQTTAEEIQRTDSPGPSLDVASIVGNDSIQTIKFSFRDGGAPTFNDRLQNALVQRKWLLQSAPPVPKPASTPPQSNGFSRPNNGTTPSSSTPRRVVGIAGLEQRGALLRQNNQAVIGTAFEDLEALMTSAKEVIEMAEQFAKQTNGAADGDSDARRLISDSASALGLVTTKDMLGTGSSAEQLYVTELSRDLAEFLTDDRKGVLRKEGGIISLVDLWQVFNRTRNGIELVSPLDFEKAATMWDTLHLPVRLRRFKSGLLAVQERSRTDEKTIASLLSWLQQPHHTFALQTGDDQKPAFGRGVTAQETAERFGWSVGVATEELEMAEEAGALCRDQCLDGIRFWENHFLRMVSGQGAA
ncbi:hypothetical protein M409DRAFT_57009 [Zasmidium cellare ATCC 36951]|uniref:Vacuolar protein-sorting-associated protein 36 n=1 Tax=Zasmidium cellare ATCC 36951 TaxID=1080233 RepID=A0A6A6CCI4_ZASCE|nr:uncharacterized protein M409DRAFT_57009 [Zasmidium cellare ATCC 36951]KAF2163898.1 hypothetical protein M409DRAFT_57009 [Zasmidium cellare ATCC 36951]